jgi:hypothetical protein
MRKRAWMRVDLPLPVLPTIPVFMPPGKVVVRPFTACSFGWWLMAGAGLFWEKSTVGLLLVADLFWEKSTAGRWLISRTNRASEQMAVVGHISPASDRKLWTHDPLALFTRYNSYSSNVFRNNFQSTTKHQIFFYCFASDLILETSIEME